MARLLKKTGRLIRLSLKKGLRFKCLTNYN
jgi:hypothetical protein